MRMRVGDRETHIRIVGCPRLYGGSSLWRGPLQTHDDLELSVLVDVLGAEAVEGGGSVYPVSEDERPEWLYEVTAPVQLTPELHGGEVVGDDLALAGLSLGEEMGVNRAADEMVLSEVSQPDLEVEDAVPHGDEAVPTEHYGGRSAGGLQEEV